MIKFVPITTNHLKELEASALPIQIEEVKASHNLPISQVADLSNRASLYSYAAEQDGKLIGVFGVVPVDELFLYNGIPWLLTCGDFKKPLLKYTKYFLKKWLEEFCVLENYIYHKYEHSLRWAKWAGFQIIEPAVPVGINGELFFKVRIGKWAQL